MPPMEPIEPIIRPMPIMKKGLIVLTMLAES